MRKHGLARQSVRGAVSNITPDSYTNTTDYSDGSPTYENHRVKANWECRITVTNQSTV
jgi:hypothetical protein